jgi:hypothetical protein
VDRTLDTPTAIGNQDWSKFDFTKWNLEGLQLDSPSATATGWVRDVTLSPQGRQNFAAALVTINTAVQSDLQDQVKTMQARSTALNAEMTTRVSSAQAQLSAFEESIRTAAAPVAVNPDPSSYQVAAKVVDQSTRLGLPGLQVRLNDTRPGTAPVASTVSDLYGNAVFKLSQQQVSNLSKDNAMLAMEVLTPAGKSVHVGGQTVIPTLNHADTLMATLPSSTDLAPHINSAKAVNTQQEGRLTALAAKPDALRAYYQQVKADLQQQLTQVQAIVASTKS